MVKSHALLSRAAALLLPLAVCWVKSAGAATPDEAKDLWPTAEKDAVIDFKDCAGRSGSLCGGIVWDFLPSAPPPPLRREAYRHG